SADDRPMAQDPPLVNDCWLYSRGLHGAHALPHTDSTLEVCPQEIHIHSPPLHAQPWSVSRHVEQRPRLKRLDLRQVTSASSASSSGTSDGACATACGLWLGQALLRTSTTRPIASSASPRVRPTSAAPWPKSWRFRRSGGRCPPRLICTCCP